MRSRKRRPPDTHQCSCSQSRWHPQARQTAATSCQGWCPWQTPACSRPAHHRSTRVCLQVRAQTGQPSALHHVNQMHTSHGTANLGHYFVQAVTAGSTVGAELWETTAMQHQRPLREALSAVPQHSLSSNWPYSCPMVMAFGFNTAVRTWNHNTHRQDSR